MNKGYVKKLIISAAVCLIINGQSAVADEPSTLPTVAAAVSNSMSATTAAVPPSSSTKSTVIQTTRKTKVQKEQDPIGGPVVVPAPLTYQQSQDVMLHSAPIVPNAPPLSPEAIEAFNIMMQNNMPLTPQQIVKLRQLIDISQRAANVPANIPPRPVSSTIMINQAPGSTPPAIRLAQGYVSALVFVDSTGSPWPIVSYDIGDPKTTTIQWDGKSNILLIQAASPYGNSDMIIKLAGLATPVTLELVLGQRVVDYRTDIHVSGMSPSTKDLPTGGGLPGNANQLLLDVLDGIAPGNGKLLTVTGGECQAWILGDNMYLRTRLTLLSPGWVSKMVSPDGMNAYEVQRSSSVLVSRYGEPVALKIEGF